MTKKRKDRDHLDIMFKDFKSKIEDKLTSIRKEIKKDLFSIIKIFFEENQEIDAIRFGCNTVKYNNNPIYTIDKFDIMLNNNTFINIREYGYNSMCNSIHIYSLVDAARNLLHNLMDLMHEIIFIFGFNQNITINRSMSILRKNNEEQ
jgi:hypothetical protein